MNYLYPAIARGRKVSSNRTTRTAATDRMLIHRVVSCFLLRGGSDHPPPGPPRGGGGPHSPTEEQQQGPLPSSLSPAPPILQVAVFRRCRTMPTFPDHWAPCSGTIEYERTTGIRSNNQGHENQIESSTSSRTSSTDRAYVETPREAADRELHEETNLSPRIRPERQYGLYVDVDYVSPKDPTASKRVIRVYPFAVPVPETEWEKPFEPAGTEHDAYRLVDIPTELERLRPAVPALALAFHHATHGQYLQSTHSLDPSPSPTATTGFPIPESIRLWANDRLSGANTMVQNAFRILNDIEEEEGEESPPRQQQPQPQQQEEQQQDASKIKVRQKQIQLARVMKMMRPSMVAITNALDRFIRSNSLSVPETATTNAETTAATKPSPRDVLEEIATLQQVSMERAVDTLWELVVRKASRSSSVSSIGKLTGQRPQQCLVDEEQMNVPEVVIVPFRIVTYSRSSTLVRILQKLYERILRHFYINPNVGRPQHVGGENVKIRLDVVCGKSSPGDEGVYMAEDIQRQVLGDMTVKTGDESDTAKGAIPATPGVKDTVTWIEDDELIRQIRTSSSYSTTTMTTTTTSSQTTGTATATNFEDDDQNRIDVILVGADCLMQDTFTNKVGTKLLLEAAAPASSASATADDRNQPHDPKAITTICCADPMKRWDDVFPPPMEEDLFEIIPNHLIDYMIV